MEEGLVLIIIVTAICGLLAVGKIVTWVDGPGCVPTLVTLAMLGLYLISTSSKKDPEPNQNTTQSSPTKINSLDDAALSQTGKTTKPPDRLAPTHERHSAEIERPFDSGASAYYQTKNTADGFINLRSGPGLRYPPVAKIPSASFPLMQTGHPIYNPQDSIYWVQVRIEDKEGFISMSFLQKIEPAQLVD